MQKEEIIFIKEIFISLFNNFFKGFMSFSLPRILFIELAKKNLYLRLVSWENNMCASITMLYALGLLVSKRAKIR